jgi:hypothetical protein
MSVTVSYISQVNVVEVLTGNVADAPGAAVTHNAFSTSLPSLGAATTPPVAQVAAFVATLAVGTLTLDFTNLTGTNGLAINGNGLQVRMIKFINPAGNANQISVAPGGANPLNLNGAAFLDILQPGHERLYYYGSNGPVIGAAAKTVLLTGTGAQTMNVIVVMG